MTTHIDNIRIGIDLGGTKIEGIALGPDGKELICHRIPTPQGDYPATLLGIKAVVDHIEKQLAAHAPVGIGTPGAISLATGKIKNSNSTCLNGQNLLEDIQHTLERKIHMANDADCFALSEAVDGAGSEAYSVFGVILGTGVGGGIVIEKQPLHGPNAICGEWGHNILPSGAPKISSAKHPEQRPCYCGRQDCIEKYLSGPGLAKSYQYRTQLDITAKEVVQRFQAGEAAACEVIETYYHQLAISLGLVINLLDPECIVLGGGISNIDTLYTEVPKIWQSYIFTDKVLTHLKKAQYGDSSGVRGAAWLN